MSTAAELVATPAAEPPFDILRAAGAELHVTDLEASERFYVDLLGLLVAERTAQAVYLRGWEERIHHSLVLRRSQVAAAARLSFRVRREGDLELLEEALRGSGLRTGWAEAPDPGLHRVLRASDPFGYPLQFFHSIELVDTQLQRFDIHRGAPILRLDHFNLHTPRLEEVLRFWSSLGFRCSEYISTDDPGQEQITGAWLLRKPSVHDVGLTAGRGPRLHHVGLWVGEPAGVLRACDQLAAAGFAGAIERGPGRHGVSNAFFVYLRDPDGHRIELYSCDYYTGDPDHRPIRWSVSDARCRSFWGARAPDSWYEESSPLLGPGGELVPISQAGVDERERWSEVMA